jgi:hypothetical protein
MDGAPPAIRSEGVERELDAPAALGARGRSSTCVTTSTPAAPLLQASCGAPTSCGCEAATSSCVLAPTLRGPETVDDAAVVEERYGDRPISTAPWSSSAGDGYRRAKVRWVTPLGEETASMS